MTFQRREGDRLFLLERECLVYCINIYKAVIIVLEDLSETMGKEQPQLVRQFLRLEAEAIMHLAEQMVQSFKELEKLGY